MKIAILWPILIVSACTSITYAQIDNDPPPPPEQSILHTERVTLPLDASAPRPTINAKINGKGPFLFVLDTGAQGFVINADLAKELHLPIVGKAAIGDPSDPSAMEVDRVRMASIDIDGVSLLGVIADSWDPPASMKGHLKGRGIFGVSMLSEFLVTFDYPGSKIVIEKGVLTKNDEHNIVEWRAKDNGLPTIKLAVGDVTFETHIDTGAPSGITLPENAREKFSYLDKPVVVGRGRTVNSEFTVWRGRLDGQAKLGKIVFENPNLHFMSMLDSTGYANIGSALLRDFVITLDHKNGLVRFKKR